MFADDKPDLSVHICEWPKVKKELINEEIEKDGDLIIAVMGEIRREKAEKQKPLNSPISKITFYSNDNETLDVLINAKEDLSGTLKIKHLDFCKGKGKGRTLPGIFNIQFLTDY